MKRFLRHVILLAGLTIAQAQAQTASPPVLEFKAGAARAVITPTRPMAMAGYAGRKDNPAEGKAQDLFAKALAIEDAQGNRVVFITTDLIGIIGRLREQVAKQAQEKFKLAPEALVMNASHTHCGPAYGREDVADYYEFLVTTMVELIGKSIESLQPAEVTYSFARAGFAMNRRTPTPEGYRNHPYPEGPVDHEVPVLRVADGEGKLRAVMFGYACHNTTMGFMQWLGDYAGYAQEYFERDHPDCTALFMMGCGGDQNPYPRSFLMLAQKHGQSLATSAEAALQTNQKPLRGPIKSVLSTVDLTFTNGNPDYAYPVQAIQFGKELTLVALAGEVTVDYSHRLKKELAREGNAIWIAGYSNDYNGYVPSKRVLQEGGYEAQSRPWDASLEERIVGKVHEVVEKVRVK